MCIKYTRTSDDGQYPTDLWCNVVFPNHIKRPNLCRSQNLVREDMWGIGCIDPRVLHFGTSWGRVDSALLCITHMHVL
jgi:hypothetical protein